jgi:putative transposase
VLTDARSVPLAITIAAANVHDQKLLATTLGGIPVRRPRPTRRHPQTLCLDKGYYSKSCANTAHERGYQPSIRARGEECQPCRGRKRARRWVIERAHSWANRARRLLVRWEKKADNYLAFVHIQFAYITLRQAKVLG